MRKASTEKRPLPVIGALLAAASRQGFGVQTSISNISRRWVAEVFEHRPGPLAADGIPTYSTFSRGANYADTQLSAIIEGLALVGVSFDYANIAVELLDNFVLEEINPLSKALTRLEDVLDAG